MRLRMVVFLLLGMVPLTLSSRSADNFGTEVAPGIIALTGRDLRPGQTEFQIPELADPYATFLKDSVLVSGTAQYFLQFHSLDDLRRGGPYQIIWNDYFYADGTPMEGQRQRRGHGWDMKPTLWASQNSNPAKNRPHLWDPKRDTDPPLVVWYGGHMRPGPSKKVSSWPEDNFSRDIFAFIEREPGRWFSLDHSLFSNRKDWPRTHGNYLGHRYGHQIVMIPRINSQGKVEEVPSVFYEEVTQTRPEGSPAVTEIFVDEMASPFETRGKPRKLLSPILPSSGGPRRFYPSAVREDGAALIEGPLYFRFHFEKEDWEAISFSAGSFYGKYSACFASRKVSDGLKGKPFLPDLTDDGSDFYPAGSQAADLLNLAGGPARLAVIVENRGWAIPSPDGFLQILFHAYRRDLFPDHDFERFPTRYRLDQMFRIAHYGLLKVKKKSNGVLRFQILTPSSQNPSEYKLLSHPKIPNQHKE